MVSIDSYRGSIIREQFQIITRTMSVDGDHGSLLWLIVSHGKMMFRHSREVLPGTKKVTYTRESERVSLEILFQVMQLIFYSILIAHVYLYILLYLLLFDYCRILSDTCESPALDMSRKSPHARNQPG